MDSGMRSCNGTTKSLAADCKKLSKSLAIVLGGSPPNSSHTNTSPFDSNCFPGHMVRRWRVLDRGSGRVSVGLFRFSRNLRPKLDIPDYDDCTALHFVAVQDTWKPFDGRLRLRLPFFCYQGVCGGGVTRLSIWEWILLFSSNMHRVGN